MADYDTSELVSDIQERGSLPSNDARFTSAKILAAATLELREGIAGMLAASRTEHLVYPYTVPVVSGTAAYRMPPRAVGGALRNVSFLDTADNPRRLREVSADEVELVGGSSNQGTPFGYYVRNYEVVLVPQPNVAGTLSMPYYARPSKLVAASAVLPIVEVNIVGSAVELTLEYTDPAALTPFPYNRTTLDVVRATPGFETLVADGANSSPTNNVGTVTITFASTSALQVPSPGDYVCVPGQAPVPQAPVELHGLLAARTARRLVKAVGDDRWQSLDADVQELEAKAQDWLTGRVAGQTQQAGASIGSSGLGPFGGAFWQW